MSVKRSIWKENHLVAVFIHLKVKQSGKKQSPPVFCVYLLHENAHDCWKNYIEQKNRTLENRMESERYFWQWNAKYKTGSWNTQRQSHLVIHVKRQMNTRRETEHTCPFLEKQRQLLFLPCFCIPLLEKTIAFCIATEAIKSSGKSTTHPLEFWSDEVLHRTGFPGSRNKFVFLPPTCATRLQQPESGTRNSVNPKTTLDLSNCSQQNKFKESICENFNISWNFHSMRKVYHFQTCSFFWKERADLMFGQKHKEEQNQKLKA